NIGFSETRPNTLVAFKNISLIDGGLIFFLTSPQSISLNHRNYTYDKVFWSPSFCTPKDYDFIKQRLTERKADKKPLIIKTILSQERSTDLSYDFLREVPFIASDIAENMKREIKNALQNLASNNDNEPKQDQNNPVGDNK
ncbi:13256_t:CDS:2, partial [Funneliformis geosporum]